jgi:hypothetical protein
MIDIGVLPSVLRNHDYGASPETVAIHELHINCLVEAKQAQVVAAVVNRTNTNSRSRPRRVRFAVDQHGIIQADIQTAELPLDYDKNDMHWSVKEKEGFRHRAKREAARYSSSRRIKRLEVAFSNCTNQTSDHGQNDMLEWARGKGRGLEFHVSELFRDEQICVVLEAVLYYQQLMRNEEDTSSIEETFAMHVPLPRKWQSAMRSWRLTAAAHADSDRHAHTRPTLGYLC